MKPLIWIESVIEKFSHSRVEIKVKVTMNDTQIYECTHIEQNAPYADLGLKCISAFTKADL